jgi:hypothetical protein
LTTEQQDLPAKRIILPNIILIIGLGILLCGVACFGYHLQKLSGRQEQIREDYSTINSITFGLFSVDQWKNKVSDVIDHQINDYNITPGQKKAMQAQIEVQLHGLISKALAGINKPQRSFIGRIKKFAVDKFVDTETIQAQVPSFSRTIVDAVSSPGSTKRLKNIVSASINKLEQQTYDSTEKITTAVLSHMYQKYRVANTVDLGKQITLQLAAIRIVTNNYLFAMLGCVLLALVLWLLMRRQAHLQTTLFFMSLLFALVLLAVGITSSIIQVDAELKAFDLTLMGTNISFDHQVLYFQSKSVMGIIETLIRQSKPDAVLVGVLILLFIVILPVVRIIARGIHIISGKRLAENKVVLYLAFESAKWDMSDVMVVGILMTYIGLNGILKSELSNLEMHTSMINMSTLNDTSLQPGYFVFIAYVAFVIILSAILKRIRPHDVASPKTLRTKRSTVSIATPDR